MNKPDASRAEVSSTHFLRNQIEADLARGTLAHRRWNGRPGDGTFHAHGAVDTARIRTRFPPEPNGYLHIGHAKSIWLNFGLAADYGGQCHLRFDDTNPVKEDQEFVDGIKDAVHWLGYDWRDGDEDHLFHASDYFQALYEYAEYLISIGHAYVDQQTPDAMRLTRGTLTEPGRNSPYRDRAPDENLRLFREMRAGRHPEGSMVLRAKIDMASPNINLRDPTLYRIRFAEHHQTGSAWPIYPMYDYAHCVSDALENITHSICTLEFEDHRPLYDWCLERLVPVLRAPHWAAALDRVRSIAEEGVEARKEFALHCHNFKHKLFASAPEAKMRALFHAWEHGRGRNGDAAVLPDLDYFFELLLETPEQFAPLLAHALDERMPDPFGLPHQYEFSRLNLTYIVTSKRKLKQLVDERHCTGWDDPRMPTLVGMRRRGYTPEAIRLLCERTGVSKSDAWIDYALLEQSVRDDLDPKVPRAMAVLDPVKLVIVNWPHGQIETCTAPRHPHRPELGMRTFTLGREVWIERDDFAESPPKGFFRLYPGNLVRLKYGYVIKCIGAQKNAQGEIAEVHAEVLPDTRSGTPGADAVKVKGNISWVGATDAIEAEVRLYDRLFTEAQPDAGGRNYLEVLNPHADRSVRARIEPAVSLEIGTRYQFERHGYFIVDRESTPERPRFNRIVTLKDSWGK